MGFGRAKLDLLRSSSVSAELPDTSLEVGLRRRYPRVPLPGTGADTSQTGPHGMCGGAPPGSAARLPARASARQVSSVGCTGRAHSPPTAAARTAVRHTLDCLPRLVP